MATHYIRHQETFEAVQFIYLTREEGQPEFDRSTEWIKYALNNKLLNIDGSDLIWGYKELDRRIKPGNWIIRSIITGMLEIKSDLEFHAQFELSDKQSPMKDHSLIE